MEPALTPAFPSFLREMKKLRKYPSLHYASFCDAICTNHYFCKYKGV